MLAFPGILTFPLLNLERMNPTPGLDLEAIQGQLKFVSKH